MLTSQEIFETKIANKLNENIERVKTMACVYEFELTGDVPEQWTIDLKRESNFVYPGASGAPDCTVIVSLENLNDIIEKRVSPQMAFMTGKLKVKGNMGLALKLGSIL